LDITGYPWDWTNLQNGSVQIINNYVIDDDTCDPAVNEPIFSAIKEEYKTHWPNLTHNTIQGTFNESFYQALLSQIGTVKELAQAKCSEFPHHM